MDRSARAAAFADRSARRGNRVAADQAPRAVVPIPA